MKKFTIDDCINAIRWVDSLHKELRGGEMMYDIPKHYKWVNRTEAVNYYFSQK